jgi:23S rRNA (guanine745-N1)-methyltransferase
MVSARQTFLMAGHYAPMADALKAATVRHARNPNLVFEAGAGPGYYIARVLDVFPLACGLALDLSTNAARRAARAHPRLSAVVADAFDGLPLKDESVDIALNIFAPRPARELARTLRPNGKLIVAVPTQAHLEEVRKSLRLLNVDPEKEVRLATSLSPWFRRVETETVRWNMTLERSVVAALAGMGPSARHVEPAERHALVARLPTLTPVTGSVDLRVYVRLRPDLQTRVAE